MAMVFFPEIMEARGGRMTLLNCWKKRTVTSQFYNQWKYRYIQSVNKGEDTNGKPAVPIWFPKTEGFPWIQDF